MNPKVIAIGLVLLALVLAGCTTTPIIPDGNAGIIKFGIPTPIGKVGDTKKLEDGALSLTLLNYFGGSYCNDHGCVDGIGPLNATFSVKKIQTGEEKEVQVIVINTAGGTEGVNELPFYPDDAHKYELLVQFQNPGMMTITKESIPTASCSKELKTCPDGTTVGRIAPACEFAACPGINGETTIQFNIWTQFKTEQTLTVFNQSLDIQLVRFQPPGGNETYFVGLAELLFKDSNTGQIQTIDLMGGQNSYGQKTNVPFRQDLEFKYRIEPTGVKLLIQNKKEINNNLIDCSHQACLTGSICYNSMICDHFNNTCGPQNGDLKCHKSCTTDSDCPAETPSCESKDFWIGDAGHRQNICV